MDISGTIAPDSPQLDAVDLVEPQTFTIESASPGAADQPVNIHLAGFPRPWRPGLSMRRVLVALWGKETDNYVGRRLTLFCDGTVEFGGKAVGGIRISHMSHIDGRKKVPLLVSRGKSAMYAVDPLKEAAPPALSARDLMLAEVKEAAEKAGVDLATVAAEWAEAHDGQAIREATDIGGLELVRDDLIGRAS